MTKEERFLAGERFSIAGREGVFNLNLDGHPSFPIHDLNRYDHANSEGTFEAIVELKATCFQCTNNFLGRNITTRISFAELEFENLAYLH